MPEDSTLRPEQTAGSGGMLQREGLQREETSQPVMAQAQATASDEAVHCPVCGAINSAEDAYCASCGAALHGAKCPNCGSDIDADADFCEVCHRYIRTDVCSFCGGAIAPGDTFCPECGSPRGGIVCPTCHTLNDFSFCKQCGTPLTDEARQTVEQLRQSPDYQRMVAVAREYAELSMQLPYSSERDIMREDANNVLRERVLKLLAQDRGLPHTEIVPPPRRLTKEALNQRKQAIMSQLSQMLDGMSLPPTPSPAKARNYAMAQKPAGVRLAWQCNYKHAMHSSPCGCAKPQMGGKWVILGMGSSQEIKDDR